MWGVGCIFSEMISSHPLFPGANNTEQLNMIWKILGTPTPETWPNIEAYTEYKPSTFGIYPRQELSTVVPRSVSDGRSIATDLLLVWTRLASSFFSISCSTSRRSEYQVSMHCVILTSGSSARMYSCLNPVCWAQYQYAPALTFTCRSFRISRRFAALSPRRRRLPPTQGQQGYGHRNMNPTRVLCIADKGRRQSVRF